MWTRPADRAPSYGTYGQGVDKCAALAHPLPTLAALATTSSPLQQLVQVQQARAPSAPSRLTEPGGRAAACSMRSSPPRPIPHCAVTRARLRSQPAGRWPDPSSTRGDTTPQTREREAPPRPVRAGRNRGQITQESRSSVPGIAVKCAGIRRLIQSQPNHNHFQSPPRMQVGTQHELASRCTKAQLKRRHSDVQLVKTVPDYLSS